MKHENLLTVTSAVSVFLLSVHVSDDIAHGFDAAGRTNLIAVAVLAGFLYVMFIFRDRLAGLIVILLTAIFALAMPVLHLGSARINETARADGGILFIWTLWALGITGILGLILTVHEFMVRRRRSGVGSID